VAEGGGLEAQPEFRVAREEVSPGGGQTHPAAWTAAGHAFDELEARRPLELLQIAPRVPVGDAELGGRPPERAALVDQAKQLRAAAAELRPLAEYHPHSYLWVHDLARGYAKTREIGS